MSSSAMTILETVLSHVPPGGNPYAFVGNYLKAALSSRTIAGTSNPAAFVANLSVIIGIYSISCFLALFTLYVKYRHGSLWFFRRRETLHGYIYAPNTMVLFVVWILFFSCSASIYLGLLIGALHHTMTPVPAFALMAFCWIPMTLALLSEAHGMAVTVFLCHQEKKLFGRWPLHANVVNITAVALYISITVALVPYFALAAQSTQKAFDGLALFVGWLSARAEAWDGTAGFQLDAESIGFVTSLVHAATDAASYLGNGFKVFFFCVLASALVFLPVALSYLSLLSTQMQHQHYRRRSSSFANEKRRSSGSSQEDRHELNTSFRLMAIETGLVSFCIAMYLALNAWTGWKAREIIGNAHLIIVQHLLFYWTFAAFGAPVAALVAYRSWAAYRAERFFGLPGLTASPFGSPRSPRVEQTINIHRETSTKIDSPTSSSYELDESKKPEGDLSSFRITFLDSMQPQV